MEEYEKRDMGLLNSTKELRELILKHPELPLLILVGDECNGGDYRYMTCSSVKAQVGEFLDCRQDVNSDYCFIDRDEFQEALENRYFDGTDAEFERFVEDQMAEYEPYWKPCIILYIDS